MLGVWILVIGVIVFFITFIYLERTIPDPEAIALRRVSESTKIYDRTGQILLYDIHGEEKRTIVPWDQIPQSIKNATMASEDANFYNHGGLDFKGIARAFFKDIRQFNLSQGGSTITQQLIKNALLGQQKTFSRKLREIILSIEIEHRFSKDQIFWMYLNQIPYGSNAYGIEAASKTYFGKNASQLTIAESALLAALIKAPTYYSPYGNHTEELMAREKFVLGKMRDLNFINEGQYRTAIDEKLTFKSTIENIIAPHFVVMVKEYLTEKYGEELVENGGLKIITTLDSNFQLIAEEVVDKYSKINKEKYKADNAALLAVDPKSGEVLALVGSSNYFDIQNEGNFNVITSPNRQPGSSFKPLAYAAALEKGFTDSTIVFDLKTEFNPYCSADGNQLKDQYGLACYHPQNYDGKFRGPVTLRQALAQSLNVPSVKILYLAGIEETISLAKKMGITTLENRSFGLSLVLGGAEVKPIDMAAAYSVFANDGIKNPTIIIKQVKMPDESILEEAQNNPTRVLEPQIARLINNILSDNSARAPIFGYSSPLYIPGRDVATKTGTTQENRDAWVMGYAPNLTVAVWSGNNNNKPMTRAGAGISASGPMWNEFITRALVALPEEKFIKPDPVTISKIMLDGNYVFTNNEVDGQEYHTILYYVDRDDPRGPSPHDPNKDPQFKNWESAVKYIYNTPF